MEICVTKLTASLVLHALNLSCRRSSLLLYKYLLTAHVKTAAGVGLWTMTPSHYNETVHRTIWVPKLFVADRLVPYA